jgi:hypothetical protein
MLHPVQTTLVNLLFHASFYPQFLRSSFCLVMSTKPSPNHDYSAACRLLNAEYSLAKEKSENAGALA